MKYLLFLASTAFFLLFGCGHGAQQRVEEVAAEPSSTVMASQQEDAQVPFPVYDFEGFEPLLQQTDGKTYVVNFWATWCKPCLEELPYFERLHAEQKDNNVEVILVSLDTPSMWKTRLEPFVAKKALQAKVVILNDPKQNDWIPKVAESWEGGIPATLIYNAQKRSFYEQAFTYEGLTNAVNPFIQ